MSFYLDTSVVVALLTPETLTERASGFIAANRGPLLVSDLASAEFASAIARRVRTGEVTLDEARQDLADFDLWFIGSTQRVEISAVDVAVATSFLRRFDLPLLTPDAIHVAAAQRLGTTLVTLDRQMAASARSLGIAVAEP